MNAISNQLNAGLFVFEEDEQRPVSLSNVEIESTIYDVSSITTLVQTYKNMENQAIEAVYVFPVEESAVVNDFEIITEGKTIRGITEEKEKAFEIYDQAIENGDCGFLLDQEKEDILNISVGNLKPGQEVQIKISYVAECPIFDGIIRYQIPVTVSPRYAPAGTDPAEHARITPSYALSVPYRFSIKVKAKKEFAEDFSSPSHLIKIRQDDQYSIIELDNRGEPLDRDFILETRIREKQKPVCLMSTHQNSDTALMFRFIPEFDALELPKESKSEVIFILDCSGSMCGSSINNAVQALQLSTCSLNEGDLFNIILFGSEFRLFRKESIEYNDKNSMIAAEFIRRIKADLGGTELYEPIKWVCGLPKIAGYNRDVVLITDGEVFDTEKIIREVAAASDKMRVFSFGIGYGASHELVKGIAQAGNGACEMIQPGEIIQTKVLRQFSRIAAPNLTDISIRVDHAEIEEGEIIPTIFEDDSFTFYARVKKKEENPAITLSAKYGDTEYQWNADIIDQGQDNSIPCLWAKSRIKRIKAFGPGGSNQIERKEKKIEQQITELGLKYNILTDYTSFVGIQERSGNEKKHGVPKFRKIPVTLTKDWHGIDFEDQVADCCSARVGFLRKNVMCCSADFDCLDMSRGGADLAESIEECPVEEEPEIKKSDEEQWYYDVLSSQKARGYFDCVDLILEKTGISRELFQETADKIECGDKGLKELILATWIACELIKKDRETYQICKRAVDKAEKWLKKSISEENLQKITNDLEI